MSKLYQLVPTPGNGEGGRWPEKAGQYHVKALGGPLHTLIWDGAAQWSIFHVTHWLEEVPQPERVPITPEALEAAGWKEVEGCLFELDGSQIIIYDSLSPMFRYKEWKGFAKFHSLKTMNQLDSLLEMLGVQP